MKSLKAKKKQAEAIYSTLLANYPEAECSLVFENPLQLLVATQLAAQCTDKRVNVVTESLFKKYVSAEDYANASVAEFEDDIRSTGFFRNKANNIIECCKILVDKYDGNVPSDMDELLQLPGIGRKTANVIRGEAYGIPGMVVDTHAGRLSRRFGLTENTDPVKVEYDIMKILPAERWNKFSHLMIEHGRAVCRARKPQCEGCFLSDVCDKRIK